MRLVALVGVAAAAVVLVPATASSAASPVPYTDPAAQGTIALCDQQGHALTSGSIYGKPFVWRAVSSKQAPKGYTAAGRTAALYAYQPIKDVDPSQWEGEYLTAGSKYTSATMPMAAASPVDPTLADYLGDYPTKWNGLVQLRMFLGAPRLPTYTQTYATATLQITGTTWTMLAGSTAGCASGTSQSVEIRNVPSVAALPTPSIGAVSAPPGVTIPKTSTAPTPTQSSGSSSGTPASGSTSYVAPATAVAGGASSGSDSSAAANEHPAASSKSSSSGVVITVVVIAVVLIAAASGLLWRRRRAGT